MTKKSDDKAKAPKAEPLKDADLDKARGGLGGNDDGSFRTGGKGFTATDDLWAKGKSPKPTVPKLEAEADDE